MPVRICIPTPTSGDPAYNHRCWREYAAAVVLCGAEPVECGLQLTAQARRELFASCAGFILPGSPADVDPARYGQKRQDACTAPDRERETADLEILEEVRRTGKPLLGICFGMQILNVAMGGTLLQDLSPLPVNHSSGAGVAIAHTVLVPEATLLGSLLDIEEAQHDRGFLRLPVNSSHHQAVGIAALHAVARSPEDGVLEAIEGDAWQSHFVLGVQWHPERSIDRSASSRNIFAALVKAAERFA